MRIIAEERLKTQKELMEKELLAQQAENARLKFQAELELKRAQEQMELERQKVRAELEL